MTTKRTHDSISPSDGEDGAPQPSKRQRNKQSGSNGHSSKSREPTTDLTYGQRSMFPSLEDSTVASDDDIEFEDEGDALAYLQSVRQEASGIPHLLVAPRAGPQLPSQYNSSNPSYDDDEVIDRSIYYDGRGDTRGYYQDGAYTAAPEYADELNGDSPDDELQQAYFTSLTTHFISLRKHLHQDPPDSVIQSLPRKHSPNVGPLGPRSPTSKIWSLRVRDTDPWPAQVAAMDKVSILRLLRVILQSKFLKPGRELAERTSRWLWALLARLPERGEMDHVEIATLRELGKRAVLMTTSIVHLAALREQADLDEGGDDNLWGDEVEEDDAWAEEEATSLDHNSKIARAAKGDEEPEEGEVSNEPAAQDSEADIEAARARLLARLEGTDAEAADREATTAQAASDETRAQMNLRATLNMVLTVAGEFYGQRDLLEFRDPFAAAAASQ